MTELRLNKQDVDWREVEGEVIALRRSTAAYLGVNPAGHSPVARAARRAPTRRRSPSCWSSATGSPADAARADVSAFSDSCGRRGSSRPADRVVPLIATVRRRLDPQALRARVVDASARSGACAASCAPERSTTCHAGSTRARWMPRGGASTRSSGACRRSCLERSLVLQRWLAARGDPRDVVIGVRAPSTGFRRTPGSRASRAGDFDELLRLSP